MNISDIIVDAPLWQWFLGITIALGLTILRYPGIKWGLAALRLLILSTLCFLLLEPLIKLLSEERDPATVVLLHDASMSQWLGPDSLERREAISAFAESSGALFEAEGFSVEILDFGKELKARTSFDCSEERTDLGAALEGLNDIYSNRNISAVVVSTDGLSNRGRDPEFSINLLDAPHYFIGTGDTTQIVDLEISNLYANEVTYLDNEFPVEVRLNAKGLSGSTPTIHIYVDGKKVETAKWSIESEKDFEVLRFNLRAESAGVKKVKVAISPLPGETISNNNYATAYIEVLESKRKVLIAAKAPHPDVNALRLSLESNKHQEVEVLWGYEVEELAKLPKHDVLILHNLPSEKPMGAISSAIASDSPIAIVGGEGVVWNSIPLERKGFSIVEKGGSQEVNASVQNGFSLYEKPSDRELLYLPPLQSPIAEFKQNSSLSSLLNQRLGSLETEWPLLAFNSDAKGRRTASLLGEGIWRWRMDLFLKEGNHDYFDALANDMIQYLSSRDDVKRFRVKGVKRLDADERLKFSAQIYNAALQPTTDEDIWLKLVDGEGLEREFSFSIENDSYSLDCGKLEAGEYNWTARTFIDGLKKTAAGTVLVEEVRAEVSSAPANHGLLSRIAKGTGGELLGAIGKGYNEVDGEVWSKRVAGRSNKKDVVHEYTERLDLINLDYILWIILGALSIEWIVRRRQGGY